MLPACAGMVPGVGDEHVLGDGAPRVCGDGPWRSRATRSALPCSPRTRGSEQYPTSHQPLLPYPEFMSQVHIPYSVSQDETGWWCARAELPGGGANGEGQSPEEAVADLREALVGWFAEFGVPETVTLDVG